MKQWELYAEKNRLLLERTLEELAQIPAPSYHEEKRRLYCERWLDRFQIPYSSDDKGNLIIPYRIGGNGKNRAVIAHMDIVFDETVPLTLRKEENIWYCPGIGDNTANVVLLLLAAKYLYEEQPETKNGIWLAVDTCEEGLGNLAGCRKVMEDIGKEIEAVLAFDLYRNKIYTGCIGSVRYRITARTPGGHSFADFGKRNAIHVLAELVNCLYRYQTVGCTTYNVGMISGGTSVNTIAQEAYMLFEYRSDLSGKMKACREYLDFCLEQANADPQATVTCETVGERPCAEKADEDKISKIADCCSMQIQQAMGVVPQQAKASTDCNIPLSLGIPAVCAGFFRGGGAHTREEWIDMATAKTALIAAVGCVVNLAQLDL